MLDFIFDKHQNQVTSDDVKGVDNVNPSSAMMTQREDVLVKCLVFLRLLARLGT